MAGRDMGLSLTYVLKAYTMKAVSSMVVSRLLPDTLEVKLRTKKMQTVDLSHEDVHTYLARHQRKELLRFLTCGSVDDGKSTLIGRLLHDTKMIYEDQLAAV